MSPQKKSDTIDLERSLEQRADFIPYDELRSGTATGDFFDKVHVALTERGTRLIVGPRGCGKTHMMRYTWVTCRDDRQSPFCVYVSFNRYYRLEPLLKSRANALDLFHSWVLARILLGVFETAEALAENDLQLAQLISEIGLNSDQMYTLISKLERALPLSDEDDALIISISLERTKDIINYTSTHFGRKRSILLLDDAALLLTPEYMIEFFDIVRTIKTTHISPKASVYPGTTEYGPRFHANQEGELIPLWLSVEDPNYSAVMGAIADLRFSELDTVPMEVSELFKYAAFGIPRAYLSMLYEYKRGEFVTSQQGINKIIENFIGARIDEYRSLSLKAPKFGTLINSGEKVFQNIVHGLKTLNDTLVERDEKQFKVGISDAYDQPFVGRLFRLLVEAGLLYQHQQVSHGGPDRTYQRFTPHIAALLQLRAFSGKKRGASTKQIVEALQRKSSKQPLRKSMKNLLFADELNSLSFDLPPCKKCGTARLSDNQRYCHICGSELLDGSTFAECMAIPLCDVPGLTSWQRDKIKVQLSTIKNIGDLLAIQDPGTELRKIHRVGHVRASRIFEVVSRFVEEFLS